ncbi:ubiquitin-protein transferase activating protein, partial [Cichlidogyrus casuarinus]
NPAKVLDAPNLEAVFNLNLIDWSNEGFLAVGLANEVYLWNSEDGTTSKLMTTEYLDEKVTSVKWSPVATDILAIGTSAGTVQLWNASTTGRLRNMRMSEERSSNRVPSLAWLDHLVSAGSFTGYISHHDIRIADHEISVCRGHTQEVCGLAWSPDKKMLASGGNDNIVNIWNADMACGTQPTPSRTLLDHRSTVKALAWCPWKPNLLVTGGGLTDHHLRFWNASTGALVKAVDVQNQVSGIMWNQEHREILTSHGSGAELLRLWKYPSVTLIADLQSSRTSRFLGLAPSPDGEYAACLSSEEEIQIWQPFPRDESRKKETLPQLNILDQKLISDLDTVLFDEFLKSSGTAYCPKGCQTPAVKDEDGLAICSECNYCFCYRCFSQYHSGYPCTSNPYVKMPDKIKDEDERQSFIRLYGLREVEKFEEEMATYEFMENVRCCPKCSNKVDKLMGCNKMTCIFCKCYFCWICLARLPT